jgi:hypothetical protein
LFYLSVPELGIWQVLPVSPLIKRQFLAALSLLRNRGINAGQVFVATDDVIWCKSKTASSQMGAV